MIVLFHLCENLAVTSSEVVAFSFELLELFRDTVLQLGHHLAAALRKQERNSITKRHLRAVCFSTYDLRNLTAR